MSVSGIQAPNLLVTVVDYSILKTVSLYPWQQFYAVVEYGGRKYKKEDRKSTTKENFQIELNEGLSEMEIYVFKGSEIFVGAGKFKLSQGLDNSKRSVILNTTDGRYVGEVALILQYSKAISTKQLFSIKGSFPTSSSHPSMSVSGIQYPHLEVTVVNYRILKAVELYPWQHFYTVIEYGGRKYKKEGQNRSTKENFVIELITGLNKMDIYVLKGTTETFIGAGRFELFHPSDNGNRSIILNTTSRRYIGEVDLVVKYSKSIVYNASDIMDSTNEVEESSRMKASLLPSNNMKVIEKLNEVVISKEEDIASFESSGGFLGELEKSTPKQFSPIDLKKFTSDFADKAGKGGFGTVYKGQFRDGVKIAVKVLEDNGFAEKSFKAEVSTMFKTSHRNLVKFYGYCFDHNMKAIVYEYMENGSLDAILYGNPRKLEWQKFYKISVEIAKGLSYLHDGCDDQIIHHDLKPANVLLDINLSAKITDFGLARLIDKDLTHITWTNCGGTIGYMAPEIFMQSSTITSKCDVYSFGMILFEVLRMKKNNVDSVWFPKQVWLKFDNGEIEELLDDVNIDKKEDRARAEVLCLVALWCTQFMSEARPSVSKVVMMLEGQIPIEKPPNPRY